MKFIISTHNLFFLPKIVKTIILINNHAKGFAGSGGKKLVTVSPDTTIKEVAEILASREFHALPVCEGDLLVGIVTTKDLIKYLIEQY
jgi:CBS domain-containing protein